MDWRNFKKEEKELRYTQLYGTVEFHKEMRGEVGLNEEKGRVKKSLCDSTITEKMRRERQKLIERYNRNIKVMQLK